MKKGKERKRNSSKKKKKQRNKEKTSKKLKCKRRRDYESGTTSTSSDSSSISNNSDSADINQMDLPKDVSLSKIREIYFHYLKKKIEENYVKFWSQNLNTENHETLSLKIEQQALLECMQPQIYQKAMIKIISDISDCTKKCLLYPDLIIKTEDTKQNENKLIKTESHEVQKLNKESLFSNVQRSHTHSKGSLGSNVQTSQTLVKESVCSNAESSQTHSEGSSCSNVQRSQILSQASSCSNVQTHQTHSQGFSCSNVQRSHTHSKGSLGSNVQISQTLVKESVCSNAESSQTQSKGVPCSNVHRRETHTGIKESVCSNVQMHQTHSQGSSCSNVQSHQTHSQGSSCSNVQTNQTHSQGYPCSNVHNIPTIISCQVYKHEPMKPVSRVQPQQQTEHKNTADEISKNMEEREELVKMLEDNEEEEDSLDKQLMEVGEGYKENLNTRVEKFKQLFGFDESSSNESDKSDKSDKQVETVCDNNVREDADLKTNKCKDGNVWLYEKNIQLYKLKHECPADKSREFNDLFGDEESDEDVTDKVYNASCIERIIPWVVKYLMPYYKQRRIVGRLVFKRLARYISEYIISVHKYPHEQRVEHMVSKFFREKKCYRSETDVYSAKLK